MKLKIAVEVATVAMGVVAIATFMKSLWPTDSPYCYVFQANGQPLPYAHVGNNQGPYIQTDELGRFEVPGWKKGTTIYVFSVAGDPKIRKLLGTATLKKRGGEWEPIRLKPS